MSLSEYHSLVHELRRNGAWPTDNWYQNDSGPIPNQDKCGTRPNSNFYKTGTSSTPEWRQGVSTFSRNSWNQTYSRQGYNSNVSSLVLCIKFYVHIFNIIITDYLDNGQYVFVAQLRSYKMRHIKL